MDGASAGGAWSLELEGAWSFSLGTSFQVFFSRENRLVPLAGWAVCSSTPLEARHRQSRRILKVAQPAFFPRPPSPAIFDDVAVAEPHPPV